MKAVDREENMAGKKCGNCIDSLDKKIIIALQNNARRPYKELAKKFEVSEGTIKNRVTRMIDKGILVLEARVNPFALGNQIAAIVGVNLKDRNHEEKIKEIEKIEGVTSVWNATGKFDVFFEIMVESLSALNEVLFRKDLNEIGGITYTETFVILHSNTKYFKLF